MLLILCFHILPISHNNISTHLHMCIILADNILVHIYKCIIHVNGEYKKNSHFRILSDTL